LYVHPTLTPEDLYRQISETDMPRLWIPKRENLYPVEALPQLGSGKLDLRGVKIRALELVGQASWPVPCSTPQIHL
jgi:acyl-[acyl-carrier-protein]-phospholipid O-acyltransferase/long-chain-fatty-acid--[acyl-carrier-protein] ligase